MQKYGLSLSLVPLTNHFLAAMVRATQQSVVCVIYSRYGNGEQARREGRTEGGRRSAHVQKLKERAPSARSLARLRATRVEGRWDGIMQHNKCRFVARRHGSLGRRQTTSLRSLLFALGKLSQPPSFGVIQHQRNHGPRSWSHESRTTPH